MKKIPLLAGLAALLAAGPAQAQDVKLHLIAEAWYTQMLDSNLRLDKAEPDGYMTNPSLNAAFKENQFYIRRCEIHLTGTINDQISWNLQADPSATTSASNPTILNDAFIIWKPTGALSVRVGQFKPLQTYESTMESADLLVFYDRSMLARLFGDKRDRGLVVAYEFGRAGGLRGKMNLGVVNGTTDQTSGKGADANAQKDWVARLDMTRGKDQKFGVYYREGVTDAKEENLVAGTGWSGPGYVNPPGSGEILANKDRTTNLGAYYVFETSRWLASAEAITGLLGRRFATVFDTTPAPVKRQHLDQKYLGYTLSAAYKMGHHWITARYDVMDFNQGRDWYSATDPYTTHVATGAATGDDYTPKFTEAILGYDYIFNPAKPSLGRIKVDYIHRSKNFLQPRAGQTGEQGGDSLVASIVVGY